MFDRVHHVHEDGLISACCCETANKGKFAKLDGTIHGCAFAFSCNTPHPDSDSRNLQLR